MSIAYYIFQTWPQQLLPILQALLQCDFAPVTSTGIASFPALESGLALGLTCGRKKNVLKTVHSHSCQNGYLN